MMRCVFVCALMCCMCVYVCMCACVHEYCMCVCVCMCAWICVLVCLSVCMCATCYVHYPSPCRMLTASLEEKSQFTCSSSSLPPRRELRPFVRPLSQLQRTTRERCVGGTGRRPLSASSSPCLIVPSASGRMSQCVLCGMTTVASLCSVAVSSLLGHLCANWHRCGG